MTVPDDLVIKSNDLRALDSPISLGALNLTLGGNLYVGRTPYDQTRIWGTVNTVRGTYSFQGRQFTILRDGTVRFEGLDALDPELNIRTERVIQAVTTNVDVRGTIKQPQIVLSSVPPLEEADILSLILFSLAPGSRSRWRNARRNWRWAPSPPSSRIRLATRSG